MSWLRLHQMMQQRGDGMVPKLQQVMEAHLAIWQGAQGSGAEDQVVQIADFSDRHAKVVGPAPKARLTGADCTNVVVLNRQPVALKQNSA
ncbi:MAG: hypothetical protein AAF468_03495 [Pseudomonadota bacterium]